MAKANKRQRLTKEEIKAENAKLRKDMKKNVSTSKEDQERIVNALRGKNFVAYALCCFLPIIGIWWIWKNQEDLKLNRSSVLLWTFIGGIILVEQVLIVWNVMHGVPLSEAAPKGSRGTAAVIASMFM